MGRKKKPANELLITTGVKLHPDTIARLEKESVTQEKAVGTLAREYIELGLDTEMHAPGINDAREFLKVWCQLPEAWRKVIWGIIQYLYTEAAKAEMPITEEIPKRQLKSIKSGGAKR